MDEYSKYYLINIVCFMTIKKFIQTIPSLWNVKLSYQHLHGHFASLLFVLGQFDLFVLPFERI